MTDKNQQEQTAMQRQVELLSAALGRAKENDGLFLNPLGKKTPALYPKLLPVSHFNALTLALRSDEKGYSTNLYTMYVDAKKRGDSVLTGEKGVPYIWYYWNDFVAKDDQQKKISRDDYKSLSPEEQSKYKPVRTKEIRTLFNLQQTSLPESDKVAFDKAVKEYGPNAGREDTVQDEKKLHMEVNEAIEAMKGNLVKGGKDATGVAHYDPKKDIVFIPAQKNYQDYPSYVQDVIRQMVTATGQPQRLSRKGASADLSTSQTLKQRERLIVELASSIKMMQFGLQARIAPESMPMIDAWKESIEENPKLIDAIEVDINNALGMIDKAERGEKIELKEVHELAADLPQDFNAKVQMLQDDDKRWMLYIKPESEKAFAVYPSKEDVGRFFAAAKSKKGDIDTARQQLAQKYYTLASQNPGIKTDLLGKAPDGVDMPRIQKVNIFKSKEGTILCHIEVDGIKDLKSRVVSPAQWQKMWLAEDKEEYKRNLAAKLYQDVLRQQKEEQLMNSPEQKEKEEREEKAKEELTKAETAAVASLVLSPLLPKFKEIKEKEPEAIILFHRGKHYETIKEDAVKTSKLLGITLNRSSSFCDENRKPLEMASFPQRALDTYLPKLVEAGGGRVAIEMEDPPEQKVQEEQEKQSKPVEENKEDVSRGHHR